DIVRLGRCPCDPQQLNDFDRPFAGINVAGVGTPSDIATTVLLIAPSAVDMLDVWLSHGSVPEWFEDSVVIGEALIVGGALNEVIKYAFQRPRPFAYGIDPWDPRLSDANTYLSFYSLAGAEAFTALTAGAMTYALRHP